MRDYAKVSPKFWTGDTGKALRRRGTEAVVVALYLMTAPGSNMLGLYYQPVMYLAHETGLGLEGASKGLRDCVEVGFCHYDSDTEIVWVVEMAAFQVAPSLKASDNRCAGIQREYDALPKCPFLGDFFDRYAAAYHLTTRRGSEGAPKPLPSQEQEQAQEQEQEEASSADADEAPAAPPPPRTEPVLTLVPTAPRLACPHAAIVALYHEVLPSLRRVRVWNGTREKHLGRRWAEDPERQSLDWWRGFFAYVGKSSFLMGRATGHAGRPFDCHLEWLVNPTNFAKVLEGKYEDAAA